PAPMMRTVVRPDSRTASTCWRSRDECVDSIIFDLPLLWMFSPSTRRATRATRMHICARIGAEDDMTTDAARDRKLIAALTAAQLYYMQDQTMEVIARELGTSRSSVSRLLSFAREVGLVD